jgi:hypothetical protein
VFATLLGPLPRPLLADDAAPEAILDAVLEVQASNGLEPLTDGGWPVAPEDVVASWVAVSRRAGGLVKAVVRGPLSGGGSLAAVRAIVQGLADAGCTWIEVHEPGATTIGADPDARTRFADAHRALTEGLGTVHLSLAITGGSADAAGIDTILAGTYASLALDLIDGPDNWRLAVAAPSDRGIVCGALATRAGSDDGPELLLWAAGYAASTGGRGPDRVGLATAGSLAALPWDVAARKVERLGHAARLAALPADERKSAIDPRAVDIRSAALGRYDPAAPRRPRKSKKPRDRPID